MADGVGVNRVAIRRAAGAAAAQSSRTDRQIAWLLVLPAALLILALRSIRWSTRSGSRS